MRLTDGTGRRQVTLRPDGVGVLVPPFVWSSLVFDHADTALIVICDELYDETDYIRNWREFLRLKGAAVTGAVIETEHEARR